MDLSRPTYIKVRRRYLHPDTLDCYQLPWEYDIVSCLSVSERIKSHKILIQHSMTMTIS
jgi:hypothetical protein